MSVLDDVRVSPAMQRMAADVAKGEPFYICKPANDPTPMKAVMVDKREDIPEDLRKGIIFVEKPEDIPAGLKTNVRFNEAGDAERQNMKTGEWQKVDVPQILTQSVENPGMFVGCNNHMLIKYEPTELLESGIGTWPKTDWQTAAYQDDNGGWHNRPKVVQAALVHDGMPAFAEGGDIQRTTWETEKGEKKSGYEVHTSWGSVSKGAEGETYLLRYADDNENGSPNLNILTRTEKSAGEYLVCTQEGKPLGSFRDLDAAVQQELHSEKAPKRPLPSVGVESTEKQGEEQFQ